MSDEINRSRKLALPRETVLETLHVLGYTEVDDYDDATLEAVLRLAVADHAAGIDARLRAVEDHDRQLVNLVDSIELMLAFFYRLPIGIMISAFIGWLMCMITGWMPNAFPISFGFAMIVSAIIIYTTGGKK